MFWTNPSAPSIHFALFAWACRQAGPQREREREREGDRERAVSHKLSTMPERILIERQTSAKDSNENDVTMRMMSQRQTDRLVMKTAMRIMSQ